MTRPAPPRLAPAEYIQTSVTGNKVSRRAVIYGAANIVLGGKCVIHHNAVLRGDLKRVVHARSGDEGGPASSSVVIVMGRYGLLQDACILRPPYKTHQGYVLRRSAPLTSSQFSFFPLRIGDHVCIGHGSVVEAAQIGSHVEIGANCVIGRMAILRDCSVVLDGAVVAPNTVVPSMCVFGGSPARLVGHLPESFRETSERESRAYYYGFSERGPA